MNFPPEQHRTRDGRAYAIRAACEREAGALVDRVLAHVTLPEATAYEPDELRLDADRMRLHIGHLTLSGSGLYLVAVAGADIVAHLTLEPSRLHRLAHSAQLGMSVRSGWRRQGVGRALLDAALRAARASPLRRVTLEVYEPNEAARRLYASAGFVEEGRLRGHVRLGDGFADALLLALSVE